MNPSKSLQDILKRDGNNFDILRLLAAVAVIVGHAYAIAPQPPHQDFILQLLHFDYSGSLAVKFFFFLSGLLVTNSIIAKPDAFQFLLKRAFRIFPGLLVCLLVSVFIVGPIFTKFSLGTYFSTGETWNYLLHNFFLSNMRWRLPGVFETSQFGLNGSLWTLPFEVLCYLFIAIFYGLSLLKNKIAANIFFIAVLAVSFIAPNYLPAYFAQNPEAHVLPGCFALGALFANNKALIPVNAGTFVLTWLLVVVLNTSVVYQFLFYVAFFYTTLFLSSLQFVRARLKLPFDASYGVYVYGFMIQQCVHFAFPGMGVYGNMAVSVAIAIPVGIVSWYFVEKKFINFGHAITAGNFLQSTKEKLGAWSRSSKWSSSSSQSSFIIFSCFMLTSFLVHAFVLRFIFPGYYSPLVPQHSDFYIPAAFAHSPDTFRSLLSWPRPVTMMFSKLIGYTGIHGSIACTIAVVCMNCALSGLLLTRILAVKFNWQLLLAFAVYCGLLFSQPYFYTFYAQDIGAQLAYFFLILGTYVLYKSMNGASVAGNIIFFCCCMLSFLSKETYGLTALAFAALWFLYARKSRSLIKAMLPFLCIAVAFVIAFIINVLIKSAFINMNASAGSPYQVSLQPLTVFKEFFRYAREAVNISNLVLILLIGFVIFRVKDLRRIPWLYIIVGCIAGTGLAILPNALLPNHHYYGYSFNGAYLFYLPLLFLPLLYAERKINKNIVIVAAIACVISPLLNISKYKDNQWTLIQEDTQRNLLKALDPLIKEISPSSNPQKVLVEGISFPFHPFAFPHSLRVFPHAQYALFDVVNYNPAMPNNQRNDLVQFISAADAGIARYDRKWTFDKDGRLISAVNITAEKIFSVSPGKQETIVVNASNFMAFTTSGFYNQENDIRWTNGHAAIILNKPVENTDSIAIKLSTYMPPVCKDVVPAVSLTATDGKLYTANFSSRKENVFEYLFVVNKESKIQKININSATIDASPDQRTLSFPFISLEIRKW